MVKNIGNFDRVIRLVFAAALTFFAATPGLNGWPAYIGLAFAAYLALSAIIDHCLVYRVLGIDTHDHGGTYHSGEDIG